MPSLNFLYKILQWSILFLVFAALIPVLDSVHPVLGLVHIPFLALISFFLLRVQIKFLTVLIIGFLADTVFFYPDGIYCISLLVFFVLSTIFWKMFHIETVFATLLYLVGSTASFFFILLAFYSVATWVLDSRVFVAYWNPLWFALNITINAFLACMLYTVIEIRKGGGYSYETVMSVK